MSRSTARNNRKLVWVLPHRDQIGDDTVIADGKLTTLSSVVDVGSLPKALILGIPEEVIGRYADEEVIFAQFVRRPSQGGGIFATSVRCGRDRTGRIVFLTALEFLGPGEFPSLKFDMIGLQPEEAGRVVRLKQQLSEEEDCWAKRVHHLLRAVQAEPDSMSFASIKLRRVHYRPAWYPEKKKPRGPDSFSL